ncbi:MAG TPA: HDOD domain-containing protein [Bryobacteraceae bacterium]|jgi:HD-like signal output (HDOD) protein|nr:HDOD domain-containing protein [Bryobacteraceae bacterium]
MVPITDFRAAALSAADRMPFLPAVFHRTLAMFARKGDDVAVNEVASLIEQDVVMAGNLISVANSALYSRSGSVCSVRQAIARIGVRKTRNALLGLSVLRSFRGVKFPQGWSAARFNDHSLATAILSDLLVQKAPAENPEWAFIAGLMHDVGLLLIATAFPEDVHMVSESENDCQLVEYEREMLGFTHFEIGARLLSRWNCPVIVQEASLFCESNEFEYRDPAPLGMVVKTASLLADATGLSVFGPQTQDLTFAPQLLEALSIEKPMSFFDAFRSEYGGFQNCATN